MQVSSSAQAAQALQLQQVKEKALAAQLLKKANVQKLAAVSAVAVRRGGQHSQGNHAGQIVLASQPSSQQQALIVGNPHLVFALDDLGVSHARRNKVSKRGYSATSDGPVCQLLELWQHSLPLFTTVVCPCILL